MIENVLHNYESAKLWNSPSIAIKAPENIPDFKILLNKHGTDQVRSNRNEHIMQYNFRLKYSKDVK